MKTKQTLMLLLVLLVVSLAREAQAFYNPSTGRWLSRDPAQEQGGLNLYGFISNDALDRGDDLGLALYVIDGTWMDRLDRANPWQLYNETTERPRRYWAGPLHGATGWDLEAIALQVFFQIQKDFCAAKANGSDLTINLTGWSRGSMIAALVAQTMNDGGFVCPGCNGSKRYRPVKVNWVGLFDAVAMTDDIGFPTRVPSNVARFDHAIKTKHTGKQLLSPTWHFSGSNERAFNNNDGSLTTHADIGMSVILGNINYAYPWIKGQAIVAGVGF
jgi:hypothetical protein